MRNIVHILLGTVLALRACGAPPANGKPGMVLESVQIDTRSVQFYVDFNSDSAVLGFSVKDDSGSPRYFPMYGSTYRGLPSVTLDIFVSDSREDMWVRSSWPGYEILAYHRLGTNRCITRYGEIISFDRPTPEMLVGDTKRFPDMESRNVSRVAIIEYEGETE